MRNRRDRVFVPFSLSPGEGGNLLYLSPRPGRDGNIGARLREAQGDGASDPSAPAGNQSAATDEAEQIGHAQKYLPNKRRPPETVG